MTRVLIVDDSATMRGLIRARLQAERGIEVVGEAADAHAARAAIKQLNPDVVTLDVEMPDMNGLEFLEKIMRLRPMPVVMVSSHTEAGAEATLRALEIGAVECIAKPTGREDRAFDTLPDAVRNAARARLRAWAPREPRAAATMSAYRPDGRLVAIGSSTGGVEALIEIVSAFPANCPPTVITQHMPPVFTASLARRLDRLSAASVSEAADGAPLAVGRVYLAPGGPAHLTVAGGQSPRCRLTPGEPVNGHRPSVDVLFNSVVRAVGGACVGVILTGMGRDGAEGLRKLRQAGAATIGQDEASCVVYGMAKAAFEIGAVERQVPLRRLAKEILALTDTHVRETC